MSNTAVARVMGRRTTVKRVGRFESRRNLPRQAAQAPLGPGARPLVRQTIEHAHSTPLSRRTQHIATPRPGRRRTERRVRPVQPARRPHPTERRHTKRQFGKYIPYMNKLCNTFSRQPGPYPACDDRRDSPCLTAQKTVSSLTPALATRVRVAREMAPL
jgi:hypothetical protein